MLLFSLLACTEPGPPPTDTVEEAAPPPCTVVTDVDETLTTDDLEFLRQVGDPEYDPAMRPEADALMRAYAEAGFNVLYLTGRGEGVELSDGRTAREATDQWLTDHGFPRSEGDLYLGDSEIGLSGEPAHVYKAGVLTQLQAEGWSFFVGYGNAEADILAYQDAGVPEIWLVGEEAGSVPVGAIPDEAAYADHLAALVLPACGP